MSNFRERSSSNIGRDEIAKCLLKENLVLFLGAGTSLAFGLPSWIQLGNALRKKVGLEENISTANTTEEIQRSIDDALRKIDFDEQRKKIFIQELLYKDCKDLTTSKVFEYPLLVALSFLLGRKKENIKEVITFNYDSMLEWFISLFGIHVASISELPENSKGSEVRVYHPQGFLPHPSLEQESSKSIILGMKDANLRLGRAGDDWRNKLKQIMESYTCLFIGLSYNSLIDRVIEPLLVEVGEQTKQTRPLGYWLYLGELNDKQKEDFYEKNIVPIVFSEKDQIPAFILSVSQRALDFSTQI